ncbi:MAG: ATP-binding protein [Chloroflexi bacterium]|nr:ATP-binding protein [Chloroflexota bacterium]
MSATTSELAFLSAALKAPRIKTVSGRLAERARSEGWDYEAYLAAVLTEEVSSRDSHGGAARVKAARFPATKTLDDFDFTIASSVDRTLIAHLAQLDFLAEAKNVVFLGPPGTGKTHCETDYPGPRLGPGAQTGAGSGGDDPKVSLAAGRSRA